MMGVKTIAVVLGMHRSGTSALARGLGALGFASGDQLLPPDPDFKRRGYSEDRDIVLFNEGLLDRLGTVWWKPGLPRDAVAQLLDDAELVAGATELLRSKLPAEGAAVIKDPRMPRLLAFWLAIFERCEVDARYFLAIRNPLQIVRSLQRRDAAFDDRMAYVLTAEHLYMPLVELEGREVFVVDYEGLLRQPQDTVRALASNLGSGAGCRGR